MKKLMLLIAATFIFSACNMKIKRNYKYVERVREQRVLGGSSIKDKEEKVISASSDSAAYLEAYKKYCISLKVYNDMRKEGMGQYLDIPIGFKLYNSDGEDITDIYFESKLAEEDAIESSILAIDNVVKRSNNSKQTKVEEAKIDSVKIKELLPFFKVKKDEFDPNGKTWYEPKSAPQYTNRNGIYLYFAVQNGKVAALRFRVQYYSDDWLFFKKIQFSIDENAYEYIPSNTETDCGNGGKIWEWFDEALTGSDRDLIYALVEAKSAKMKFIGRQYYDIKTITKNQITDMKRALDLYRAMGGTY
ncbi:MAG: hypothetical protein IJS63_09605 [Bacteroidaceae bacterium]|nr:hypothetical protein [Bacteroidaceae bacterium]